MELAVSEKEKPWRTVFSAEDREKLKATEELLRARGLRARHDFLDRQGRPMSYADWMEARVDDNYSIIHQSTIGETLISTVWVGEVVPGRPSPPAIFETVVFDRRREILQALPRRRQQDGVGEYSQFSCDDRYQERHVTEDQAERAHRQIVLAVQAGLV